MNFSEINPFGRYVRYLKITENSSFNTVLPLDCRLFYVKKGVGKIKIDNEIFTLPMGALLYINSFVPYTLLKSDVRYLAINFDFTNRHSHLTTPLPPIPVSRKEEFSPVECVTFEDAPCFNRFLFLENASALLEAFEEAEVEFTEKPPFYNLKNSAQIINILTFLFRTAELGSSNEKGFDAEKVAQYIRDHLSEELNGDTLAEHFHFHKNYISNRFCRHYGKPIHSYILEMRITKAISLLESGRSNIGEIAAKVGFCDRNYFARYFKR